jgi:putative transcriptional regulator
LGCHTGLDRELEVSRQAVNGFESGRFDPSLDMAVKIASLFNVTIESVFINEAKHFMQTLIERVKKFFSFELSFGGFSEQVIVAIILASNEAGRLQSQQVEPKHLLFGLLADPTMTSAQLLRANGATVDISIEPHGIVDSSPRSEFILELALKISQLQGRKFVETEHLLCGLVRLATTGDTTLGELFQSYGINMKTLSDELDRLTNFAGVT